MASITPILTGPPGFVLLSLALGLAAYIRGVSVAARDRIESIISQKDEKLWPANQKHTQDRLNNLDETRIYLQWVTFFLFLLAFLVGIRLAVYAYFNSALQPTFDLDLLYWVSDLVLIIFVVVLVLGMWLVHVSSSRKDKRIFNAMREWVAKHHNS